MQLAHLQFPLWRLMAVVASFACLAAALAAWSAEPVTPGSVLGGLAAFYGAPLVLIAARRVSLYRAAKIAGTIILCGLPVFGFFGLVMWPMAVLVAPLVGWFSLVAVAFFYDTLGRLVDKMFAGPPITVGEPELPPIVYDPNWAQPGKPRARRHSDGQ